MEDLLIWGLGLLALAAGLFIVEFFIPSGGVMGLAALAAAVAAVVCLFLVSPLWGAIGALLLVVGGPIAIYAALKYWPHTPIGKQILGLPSPDEREALRRRQEADAAKASALIGREARVLTDLRPVGTIDLDGVRHDALAETDFIPAGARVKVIGSDIAQLRVRALR